MASQRKKKMITMTLEPDLIERVDSWIAQQSFPPNRNAVVESALEEFLVKNNG